MARLYRSGDSYNKSFAISSATGAAANADATPTGTIYLNGAADAAAVTITNPATGVYKAAATLPGAAGDVVELLIAATVGGVATKAFVDAIRLVAFNATDAVRLGLTALPNAAAAASGGLPTIGVTIPNATAGAAGGLFIAGTNAATTVTTAFTTTFAGNLSGSVGSVTGSVGSVTGAVGSVTGNVGGNVTGTVASVVGAVGSVTGPVGSVTAPVSANVTQWLGTAAATPNVAGVPKVDLALYAGSAVTIIDGTLQAGSTTGGTLAAGSSSVDNFYRGYRLTAIGNTGAGQVGFLASYTGSSKAFVLDRTLGSALGSDTTYTLDPPVAADVVQWMGLTPSPLVSGSVQSLPPSGAVVSGSGSTLVVSGYPAGKNWDGQHVLHVPSGEIRAVNSHTYASPNYTLVVAGTFSSVTAGDAICLLS